MSARCLWGVTIALAFAASGCAGSTSNGLLTNPKPDQYRTKHVGLSPLPFGAPPVIAPRPLRTVARAYYAGAGPAPQVAELSRPACLLMLPTVLGALAPRVPVSRFNIFEEFEVTWRSSTHAEALSLFVYPPGDPSDREFFAPTAAVTTLPDGTALRATPRRPNATLVRVPTQSCEYLLEGHGTVSSSDLVVAVRSLRLVFAP